MSYSYQTERPWLFTEEGQVCLLKARDQALKLLDEAGAFMAFSTLKGVSYGDTWKALAILDRMVEMGDIREVTGSNARGQDRVFVKAR
jgi:molybdenum-dependent DNA-binding transcriptional regulator ModE